MTDEGYKDYEVAGVVVKAKKTPGGGFYHIILPDGSRLRHLASVFEDMAKEAPTTDTTKVPEVR